MVYINSLEAFKAQSTTHVGCIAQGPMQLRKVFKRRYNRHLLLKVGPRLISPNLPHARCLVRARLLPMQGFAHYRDYSVSGRIIQTKILEVGQLAKIQLNSAYSNKIKRFGRRRIKLDTEFQSIDTETGLRQGHIPFVALQEFGQFPYDDHHGCD